MKLRKRQKQIEKSYIFFPILTRSFDSITYLQIIFMIYIFYRIFTGLNGNSDYNHFDATMLGLLTAVIIIGFEQYLNEVGCNKYLERGFKLIEYKIKVIKYSETFVKYSEGKFSVYFSGNDYFFNGIEGCYFFENLISKLDKKDLIKIFIYRNLTYVISPIFLYNIYAIQENFFFIKSISDNMLLITLFSIIFFVLCLTIYNRLLVILYKKLNKIMSKSALSIFANKRIKFLI